MTTRKPARLFLSLLLLSLGAAATAAAAAERKATPSPPPARVLLYVPLHASTPAAALSDFARCTLAKPAGNAAAFDVLLVVSGVGAREAAMQRGHEFAMIVAAALDKAAAATKTVTTTAASSLSSASSSPLPPPPTITIDYLELTPEKDGYSSKENSFAGPNSAFFDTFLERKTTPEENDDGDEKRKKKKKKKKKKRGKAPSTVFERHVEGRYRLVLQLEVDVCATGDGTDGWLDAALEPLVAVVEGERKRRKRGGEGPTSGEISAAAALVSEALLREEESPLLVSPSPLLSALPAVVGATLGGGCVSVSSALPGSSSERGHRSYCSPLSAQPRHMREHLNGNALYLATSEKFQRLARVARAVTRDGDELPFDLALWAAAALLSEAEATEEKEGEREGEGGGGESRFLMRNPRMLNLGRRVEGSKIEDAAYHGGGGFISLVHAPRRLRAVLVSASAAGDASLSAATAASVAAPLSFAPPLVAVVIPRAAAAAVTATEKEEEEEKGRGEPLLLSSSLSPLVAHAARSLSPSASSSLNRGALPVFIALDPEGFEAASRAAPYSVLLASDFSGPASSGENASSALGDAAAVAAVAAALSQSGGDGRSGGGGERGVLLLSSPAVAAVGGALDETLLRLQEAGAAEGDDKEAPALLVMSRQARRKGKKGCGGGGGGSRSRGGAASASSSSAESAAAPLPEMLWAPPSGKGRVSNALRAWSRALLAEEAEKEKGAGEGEGGQRWQKTPSLSLLVSAASSARVAVERLPACVFARSPAWERATRKKRGGGFAAALSVQLVSFERECRRRSSSSATSAASCVRERLLEAGLWRGEENTGVLSD